MKSRIIGTATAAFFIACPAHAQTEADFYRGKTVTLSISAGVGGGFDTYGRTVAEHLSRFIPGNPIVAPDNRVGAGGRVTVAGPGRRRRAGSRGTPPRPRRRGR